MARSVELLYKEQPAGSGSYVLVDVKETRDARPRQYGKFETPDNGYIVVRLLGWLKDMPAELLECGGGVSRFLLDEAKMSPDERKLFKDKARFNWRAQRVKHTITPARLAKLVVDNGAAWEAVKGDWVRPANMR